ncbi:MAG: cytochrome-c peroxidase [Sandaracinaceae bacterium]
MRAGLLAVALLASACASRSTPLRGPAASTPPRAPGPELSEDERAAILARLDEPAPFRPAFEGGGLLVLADGATAVVAEPDRSILLVLDLASETHRTVFLEEGAYPADLVEDGAGRVHVVLRGPGELLSFRPAERAMGERRAVCPAPRGVAYDPSLDALHVACVGGELVTLPAAGGPPSRVLHLDPDLRDVVVQGGALYVSRHRSAEVLVVEGEEVADRVRPPPIWAGDIQFAAVVAARMVAHPEGGVLVAHHRVPEDTITVAASGVYYGPSSAPPCAPSVVGTDLSRLDRLGVLTSHRVPGMTAPLDLAVRGDRVAVVSASTDRRQPLGLRVVTLEEGELCASPADLSAEPFEHPDSSGRDLSDDDPFRAVAFRGEALLALPAAGQGGLLLYQGSDPRRIPLPDAAPRGSVGRGLFTGAPAGIACASCHPAGGDDGHVWVFDPPGPRRNQDLRGGLMATAPYHWTGDQPDLVGVIEAAFTDRIGRPVSLEEQVEVARWLQSLPMPAGSAASPEAVARGHSLFASEEAGCASCHAGRHLTNNESTDLGDGLEVQVPSLLGVGARAPYLRDGCAATLEDVLRGDCFARPEVHGGHLDEAQRADLVAYLRSL